MMTLIERLFMSICGIFIGLEVAGLIVGIYAIRTAQPDPNPEETDQLFD